MTSQSFDTPVALCVYNRPQLTKQVLSSLSSSRPSHILVIADGPKRGVLGDRERCDDVIRAIKEIEWPAEIEWNIAATNLGLRRRVQSGLSWVFGRVEEAIVLEDDCIPHPSFFSYCSTLLKHYRTDPRIAVICGSSFQFDPPYSSASYFFSRYPLVWGWAGWRRSWALYDPDLGAWDRLRDTPWLSEILANPLATAYWSLVFDQIRSGFDTWDVPLVFSCWRAGALSVQPARNLVRNIGFGRDSTHTLEANSLFANIPVHEMSFPLVHPERVERAVAQDDRTEQLAFSGTARQRLCLVRDALRAQPERIRTVWSGTRTSSQKPPISS